jgi:hypothetical protein
LSGEDGRAVAITGGPARFVRLRPQLHELAERRSDSSTPHWSRTTGSPSRAQVGEHPVFVSETVKGHLVGSAIALSEHGMHVLKGVPDGWRLYAIER